MGTALAAQLGLGLLLVALLLPTTQTGGPNSTSATPLHNNSSSTSSVPLSTLNSTITTKGHGNALQSTTGLFIFSLTLLYIC